MAENNMNTGGVMIYYKPVRILQDLNTHPTGDEGLQPTGGIRGYQDDLDSGKRKRRQLTGTKRRPVRLR